MNGSERASFMMENAFKGIKPDENGQSVTTIRAPNSRSLPTKDTYRKVSEMDKFEVRHSMIKGDGLFAPLSFVCF